MSRINRMQAEALAAPVEKAAPAAKTVAVKKTQPAKPAIVSKPTATTKPATATKTTLTKASLTKKAAPKKAEPKKEVKVKAAKPVKEKTPKLKMERDSFTMPKTVYAQFHVLKERLNKLGQPAKKSELLRAGIMQLSAMTDAALKAAMSKVPAIKTGRPKK
ncbi:MAG: hypothetical protein VW548_06050 [Methylotenera sp.]